MICLGLMGSTIVNQGVWCMKDRCSLCLPAVLHKTTVNYYLPQLEGTNHHANHQRSCKPSIIRQASKDQISPHWSVNICRIHSRLHWQGNTHQRNVKNLTYTQKFGDVNDLALIQHIMSSKTSNCTTGPQKYLNISDTTELQGVD